MSTSQVPWETESPEKCQILYERAITTYKSCVYIKLPGSFREDPIMILG